jgi:SHS2 domain-containing protein
VSRRFEILEHTADVGIDATGDTCEEAFAAAAEGLAVLLGAWVPGRGDPREVMIEAPDREALLVGWLDELIYLHEAQDLVFGGFDIRTAGDRELAAAVRTAPAEGRRPEGTAIKAATYHRLRVARRSDGTWGARVYLDV